MNNSSEFLPFPFYEEGMSPAIAILYSDEGKKYAILCEYFECRKIVKSIPIEDVISVNRFQEVYKVERELLHTKNTNGKAYCKYHKAMISKRSVIDNLKK